MFTFLKKLFVLFSSKKTQKKNFEQNLKKKNVTKQAASPQILKKNKGRQAQQIIDGSKPIDSLKKIKKK